MAGIHYRQTNGDLLVDEFDSNQLVAIGPPVISCSECRFSTAGAATLVVIKLTGPSMPGVAPLDPLWCEV